MPGQNRTGPQGAGARTGRGMGRCAPPANEVTGMEDPYNYWGLGWGYWPWGGGGATPFAGRGQGGGRRRRRGVGQGQGRGPGRAGRPSEELTSPDVAPGQLGDVLRHHVAALRAELDRVKKLIARYAPADGQGDE